MQASPNYYQQLPQAQPVMHAPNTVFMSKKRLLFLIGGLVGFILFLIIIALVISFNSKGVVLKFSVTEDQVAGKPGDSIVLNYHLSSSKKLDGRVMFDVVAASQPEISVMMRDKRFKELEKSTGKITLDLPNDVSSGKYFIRCSAVFGSKKKFQIVPLVVIKPRNVPIPKPVIPVESIEEPVEDVDEFEEEIEEPEQIEDDEIYDYELPDYDEDMDFENDELNDEFNYDYETQDDYYAPSSFDTEPFPKTVREQIQDIYFSTPNQAREFCDGLSDNDKDECLLELAQLDNKKSYCQVISDKKKKDYCYVNFALLGDYSVCPLFSKDEYRQQCEAFADSNAI